jgi:hypothetical protein
MPLIYRQGRLFKVNRSKLPVSANNSEVVEDLFVAIYREFQGADTNVKYKNLTYQVRIEMLNNFAKDWLSKKGYR